MSIRFTHTADANLWDDYVHNHPSGTVFHLFAWKQVIEQSFQHKSHYLIAIEDQEDTVVCGVLPLFEIRSLLFGHSLVSVPFAEIGGVLADNASVEEALLEEAFSLSSEIGCAYIELKNQVAIAGLPTKNLYFNFSKPLDEDPEKNLLAIPRKSRAMVRKGIKKGLVTETGIHLFDDFYEVFSRSYHTLGTPVFSRAYFRNLLAFFADDAELMVVRTEQGKSIAAVMTLYYQDRVMPYYAGSLSAYRHLAPNDFMYWQLMCKSCERGSRIFDFGRSKASTGSFSFKQHWGFEPRPLAYQYHLTNTKEMPNLSPANPKYRRKIEMWRKMPFAMTKVVGPQIAKYLG